MAHELKAKHIQTETLENKADDRILLRNILSYIEDHSSSFEDEDVVSKRFVEERLASIGEEKYIGSIESIENVDDDIPEPEEDMLIVTRDTLSVYWYDGDEWQKIGGGGGYETPEEVRDALQSLTDADRLDASAIKNIPAANLSEEITVNLGPGESVGGYSTGDVVLINTDFTTVMKKLLMKAQPVSYLAPTSALSKSPTTNYYELGSSLNITLTPTFNARDSGGIDTHVLKKNGVEVHTDFSAYLDSFVADTLGTITYSSTITYLQGACKLNNLGDQDCTGRIEAGSLTKSQTTNIILPWFYGVSDTDDVSDIYATGTKVVSNVTAELTVNSFGSGIKFMWFAVPKGSKTFTSWYRTELNQGSIGNPGDLFKAKETKLVSSSGLAQDYEDEEYDFYITSSATDASVTTKLS